MNETWHQLWSECVLKNMENMNDILNICSELAETAVNEILKKKNTKIMFSINKFIF